MTDHRLKSPLARFIREVWDEGKIEAIKAYVAPRYTIHHDPGDSWDGQVLDLVGYTERLRLSRAPFPDQKFDIQRMCAEADAVHMTWHWTATHLGDLPGLPATGAPVHTSGATIYFFDRDQLLTGHWQVTDRLGVFQQLQTNKVRVSL